MTDKEFIQLVCNAYRKLRGLTQNDEVKFTIGAHANGTLQITLKEGKKKGA